MELTVPRLEEDFSLSRSLSRLSSRITREISCSREAGSSLEANSSCNLSDNPLLKKLTSAGSFHPHLSCQNAEIPGLTKIVWWLLLNPEQGDQTPSSSLSQMCRETQELLNPPPTKLFPTGLLFKLSHEPKSLEYCSGGGTKGSLAGVEEGCAELVLGGLLTAAGVVEEVAGGWVVSRLT